MSMNKYQLSKEVLLKKENAQKAEFSQLINEYEAENYKIVNTNSFGGGEFCTLTGKNKTVNISYKEKNGILRVVSEEGINIPIDMKSEPVCDTLVTQMQTTFFSHDCGMGYIIRLGDGSFVVIDGGTAEYDEPAHFIDILNKQKINNEIPVIKAWFITHPHSDHYNLILEIYNAYSDSVKIENLIYNYPCRDYSGGWSYNADEVDKLPINKVIARTGYKFEFPGNVFEILYSPEDAIPQKFDNVNDTSIVIKQTVNQRNILYLADIGTGAAELILNEYNKDFFKAEIVQVAHHGFWGASDEMYSAIDPETLLWPTPDFWYYRMTNAEQNQFIVHSEKIKHVFFSNREEKTINMSMPVTSADPYADIKKSEILLDADFKEKSIFTLNWNCITGGQTGYAAAKAMFEDGGLRLVSQDNITVLEIVKPPVMENIKSYKLEIDVEIKNAGKFGCICNYSDPIEYSEEECFDFSPEIGEGKYSLIADEDNKKITVTKNGEVIGEYSYIPAERHGIYLVMKNADILVKKAIVKKL